MIRAASILLLPLAFVALLAGRGAAGPDPQTVRAEFKNARGLVEGGDVRVAGAVAGSVERIEVTEKGTAMVTAHLHDGAPPARADALAAIRPVDLLGDVYLALIPGDDPEPLRGAIPTARTSNAPRIDELLAAFDDPVRSGLRALLVEGGRALEGRGAHLARAVVELRPALEAADEVMSELGSQNAALGDLVVDGERAARQLASRRSDLRALIADLSDVVETTAGRRSELEQGLRELPELLDRAGGTAARLDRAATAATPLAADLASAAPPLAAVADELPPFLRDARAAATDLTPAVRLLRDVLADGSPTLGGLGRGLQDALAAAPEIDGLMRAVKPAAPAFSEGFFVNFPDQAAEPGRQPFDPLADPRRNYWRGAGVMSCEAFGMKIKPGCVDAALDYLLGE